MSDPVTFINVIDTEPSKHQDVIEILKEGTDKVMSRCSGFISVTLLASADKSCVINLARWESVDDVQATQSDPAAAEYAKRIAAVADPGPGLYTVVGEFTA